MYDGWRITRWETPVVDTSRLAMVSLIDVDHELDVLLEAVHSPGRPRWRVRFRQYPAYRNVDESYRTDLWRWLDESKQRVGSTFTVEESPRFASWGTVYLHDVVPNAQHFVIATEDDVIEVVSAQLPTWESADPAPLSSPTPGKSRHLYVGEDDAELEQLYANVKRPNDH
ncbi:MAG: hypothetical protein QM756_42955 [Polyangiaceae bacterium]